MRQGSRRVNEQQVLNLLALEQSNYAGLRNFFREIVGSSHFLKNDILKNAA